MLISWLLFCLVGYPFLTFPLACLSELVRRPILARPFQLAMLPLLFVLHRIEPTIRWGWALPLFRPYLFLGYSVLFLICIWGITTIFRPHDHHSAIILYTTAIGLILFQPLALGVALARINAPRERQRKAIEQSIRAEHSDLAVHVLTPRIEDAPARKWRLFRFTLHVAGITNTDYHYRMSVHLYEHNGSLIVGHTYHTPRRYHVNKQYYVRLVLDYDIGQSCWTYYAQPEADSRLYPHRPSGRISRKCLAPEYIRPDGSYELDLQIPFEEENTPHVQSLYLVINCFQGRTDQQQTYLYDHYFTREGVPFLPKDYRKRV